MDIYNGNFDFNKYKAFYAVSEFGSFSRAAEKLFVSQPAVSYSIKELENQLGTKLFFRENRNIELTDDGKKLKLYIEKAFNNIITGINSIKEDDLDISGEIKIGIYSHIGVFILPKVIKKFTSKHPNVNFVIFSSTDIDMKEKFKNREIDILILHYPIFLDDYEYEEKILFKLESCFYTNKYYYDKMTSSDVKQIQDLPLLLPMKGFITSNQLDMIFKNHAINLNSKIHLYTTEMTIALVKEGLGIGWGLKKSIEEYINDGIFFEVPIDVDLPVMEFSMAYNLNHISNSTKKFVECLNKEFSNGND